MVMAMTPALRDRAVLTIRRYSRASRRAKAAASHLVSRAGQDRNVKTIGG